MDRDLGIGTPIYTSDGQPAGQVEALTANEVVVNGRSFMRELVEVGPDGRATLRYTVAQLAWQTGAAPDARAALTDDPAGEGELANMIDEQRHTAGST